MSEAMDSSSTDLDSIGPTKGVHLIRGDIFAAPANSVLIHACNCQGAWNSGIAAQFKKDYPEAYSAYHDHCKSNSAGFLLGTTFMIPPQENDSRKHWIACLFTSEHYGKRVDPPADVLRYTRLALKDLVEQYQILNLLKSGFLKREDKEVQLGGLHSCKINSVRFNVPWPQTLMVMDEELGEVEGGVMVYEFEGVDPKAASSAGGINGSNNGSKHNESADAADQSNVDDIKHTRAPRFQIQSEEFHRLLLQEFQAYDAHTKEQQRSRSSSSSSSIISIDINNLPYTSPPVLPLRKSPHQFRTIVRDGPMGTAEGVDERYVVIAKRSFRGAGPWRVRGDIIVIHGKRDVKRTDGEGTKMNEQGGDEEMIDVNEDDSEEEDDDEDEDGEVEIMWDTDGFKYQLMRDPPEESGEIRKDTHWVNTRYFLS